MTTRTLQTLRATLACCSGGLISTAAMAELPPALDLVPADAPIVVAIDNFDALLGEEGAVVRLMQTLGPIPADFQEIQQLATLDGFNAAGSLAMVVIPPEGFGDAQQVVAIAPVADYGAFATGLGGSGSGVEEVQFQGEPMFIKSLGGGFAALGPARDLVSNLAGEPGNLAGHTERLGAVGEDIADRSQLLVIANMEKVGDQVKQQIEGSMMMAQMGAPPGAADGLVAMREGMNRVVADARTGILGLGISDAGATIRFGAVFGQDTETARLFQGNGRSAEIMKRLPDEPYLFAGAMDISSPQIKAVLRRMNELSAQLGGAGDVGAVSSMMDKANGAGFVFGAARMDQMMSAGAFVNSVAYLEAADPRGLMTDFQKAQEALNGQETEGIRITTTYEPDAREIDGVTADAWGMQMAPVDPAAMGMGGQQQMMAMMFGPSGLGGYIAPAEGGVALTYARNSQMLGLALGAAAAADGLGASQPVQNVATNLPAERALELYIDADEILKLVSAAMGAMGGGAMPFDPQLQLDPIAIGAGGASGGAQAAIHIPAKTLQTIVQTVTAFGGGMMMQPEPATEPDF